MKNILKIVSSPLGENSYSNKLSNAIVDKVLAANPGSTVTVHDLTTTAYPHLEEFHITSFNTPADQITDAHATALRNSDEAIQKVMDADVIVIGVPMHNFGITSTLKTWIDHVARSGKTFTFTETGAVGLVRGKKVYLAIASGSVYSDGPYKAYDFTEPYLRAILGFLGITDVTAFRVEGTAIPGIQDTALEKGINSIAI